ncbi:TPA: hypothetical protein DCW54_02690 [Candidatus Dependentiae bacterium]|nr:hypothetical protein [Candidatus Dependentiae bacterium]
MKHSLTPQPTLPTLPGVYLFITPQGEILYIGKAKNLKRRILSYFRPTNNQKIQQLIEQHERVAYIVTHSELEALLLEATLVHQHQPSFNTLLKNGNPFMYLAVTAPSAQSNQVPQLMLARNTNKKNARYYGPFIAKKDARKLYDYLINNFQLYLCNKKIPSGCLDYHIGRCAGSCKEDFDTKDYLMRLSAAEALLQGNKKNCLAFLHKQIEHFNQLLLFEKSRTIAEQIVTIEYLFDALTHKKHVQIYKKDLQNIFSESLPDEQQYQEASAELQKLAGTRIPPQTIDCFDISHFQSHQIVAAAVRFTNGTPDHNAYRRFIIKSITQQDDYAALQEAITRRYKNPNDLPDLILIDGGKGQRNAATSVLPPNATCLSIAKREERLFTPRYPEGIVLSPDTPAGALLITLRNHTHNQAITLHRIRARKSLTQKPSPHSNNPNSK